MENLRKKSYVKLVSDPNKLLKLASKQTFVSSKILDENLVAVNIKLSKLKLNRPSYVGMCILDFKTLMYDFHYNYIKKKYPENAQLLFTDTDSLTYHVKTEDVYADFYEGKDKFDNSDYSINSQFYFNHNKKSWVSLKMKQLVSLLLNLLV